MSTISDPTAKRADVEDAGPEELSTVEYAMGGHGTRGKDQDIGKSEV
jgi:hypothetical protein